MSQTALIGNPNTGKTSLFNSLTGSYEHVGNWSGVTIEKKIGKLKTEDGFLIDLPGVYSLHPLSKDEAVVIRYLLHERPQTLLNIVDASLLERNLQLTVQLLEYGKPLILCLNMVDVAERRGLKIDDRLLSKRLGVPVIPVIARKGEGCQEISVLLNQTIQTKPIAIFYGDMVERAIDSIVRLLPENLPFSARWLALHLLEQNPYAMEFAQEWISEEELKQQIEAVNQELKKHGDSTVSRSIFNTRKNWISQIVNECVVMEEKASAVNWTKRIDDVLTHKILGVPIFLAFMYLLFMMTFNWIGTPLSDMLDRFFNGPLTKWMEQLLVSIHAGPFVRALVLNGIVGGVGGVLVFIPQIFVLFFFISFLEDSGYMARAALVMDRLMEKVGLNGKAFIPMVIGFGCNVPGVMAARTIEQPKERLLTILLTPLMSCSARLPVYALFTGAFFDHHQGEIVFSLYVLGISVAFLLAKLFSSTVLKNEASIFVIELPPYRVPQWKTLWLSTWDKGKGFVRKAGTFIFGGSVFIWLLSYMGPGGVGVSMDESFLAKIGGLIAPLLVPLGFGTWQAASSLLTGFLAKEVVVSTMNIIYHAANTSSLKGVITGNFTPLSAYSFIVFILLYVPCVATVAAIRHETGSKKWTFFSIGYGLAIAYLLSFIIYQGGQLFI